MHPLFRYTLIATPLAVLLFLLMSGIHQSWDGHVVSYRPFPEQGSATRQVLIVDDDFGGTEATWPVEAVTGLELQVDPTATPPLRIPDTAATTRKDFGSLWFTVTPPAEPDPEEEAGDEASSETSAAPPAERVLPTYSARTLSMAALMWLFGLAVHNMLRSGSPFSWERGDLSLPPLPGPTGQPATSGASQSQPRSRKGPPPPKPRRGGGRRR